MRPAAVALMIPDAFTFKTKGFWYQQRNLEICVHSEYYRICRRYNGQLISWFGPITKPAFGKQTCQAGSQSSECSKEISRLAWQKDRNTLQNPNVQTTSKQNGCSFFTALALDAINCSVSTSYHTTVRPNTRHRHYNEFHQNFLTPLRPSGSKAHMCITKTTPSHSTPQYIIQQLSTSSAAASRLQSPWQHANNSKNTASHTLSGEFTRFAALLLPNPGLDPYIASRSYRWPHSLETDQ